MFAGVGWTSVPLDPKTSSKSACEKWSSTLTVRSVFWYFSFFAAFLILCVARRHVSAARVRGGQGAHALVKEALRARLDRLRVRLRVRRGSGRGRGGRGLGRARERGQRRLLRRLLLLRRAQLALELHTRQRGHHGHAAGRTSRMRRRIASTAAAGGGYGIGCVQSGTGAAARVQSQRGCVGRGGLCDVQSLSRARLPRVVGAGAGAAGVVLSITTGSDIADGERRGVGAGEVAGRGWWVGLGRAEVVVVAAAGDAAVATKMRRVAVTLCDGTCPRVTARLARFALLLAASLCSGVQTPAQV